jgi:hypothetical protein
VALRILRHIQGLRFTEGEELPVKIAFFKTTRNSLLSWLTGDIRNSIVLFMEENIVEADSHSSS